MTFEDWLKELTPQIEGITNDFESGVSGKAETNTEILKLIIAGLEKFKLAHDELNGAIENYQLEIANLNGQLDGEKLKYEATLETALNYNHLLTDAISTIKDCLSYADAKAVMLGGEAYELRDKCRTVIKQHEDLSNGNT